MCCRGGRRCCARRRWERADARRRRSGERLCVVRSRGVASRTASSAGAAGMCHALSAEPSAGGSGGCRRVQSRYRRPNPSAKTRATAPTMPSRLTMPKTIAGEDACRKRICEDVRISIGPPGCGAQEYCLIDGGPREAIGRPLSSLTTGPFWGVRPRGTTKRVRPPGTQLALSRHKEVRLFERHSERSSPEGRRASKP